MEADQRRDNMASSCRLDSRKDSFEMMRDRSGLAGNELVMGSGMF